VYRILKVETMKLQWWLLCAIAVAGPALCIAIGLAGMAPKVPGDRWLYSFGLAAMRYAWLFYPLLAGIFAALICRAEHASGGWKQMLSLPVSRTRVYVAKFAILALLLALTNLAFGAEFIAVGMAVRIPGSIPWATLAMALLSSWVAVLPLAAVQLWVSTRWRSFGAALALNVCLTLPAIFAAQSATYGPWYPWAQPVLAIMPLLDRSAGSTLNVSPMSLWVVIVGGFVVAMTGGLLTFGRADVAG
jgi:hypothetical protein